MTTSAAQTVVRSSGAGGRWTAPGTWEGGQPPQDGAHVIVMPGAHVLLDVPAVSLAWLEIHGTLEVEDDRDYQLRASRIDVGGMLSFEPKSWGGGGALLAGSPGNPFRSKLRLTLTDDHLCNGLCIGPLGSCTPENLSLLVHGGSTLRLHGDPGGGTPESPRPRRSWTTLTQGAGGVLPGAAAMPVQGHTGWRSGDRILITSTSHDWKEAEELTVVAVQEGVGEDLVLFTPALAHEHSRRRLEQAVDTMAEVALLSRNITITSEVQAAPQIQDGNQIREEIRAGHVMVMNHVGAHPDPVIELDWVEFTQLGWKGMLGRYPVHFHLLGRPKGGGRSLHVRHCSIHHCFNRGLVVHGTDQVVVEGNVLYDTMGHMVYLEDGSEENNVFLDNLASGARVPTLPLDPSIHSPTAFGQPWPSIHKLWFITPSTLQRNYFTAEEATPAVFWITNTDNVFRGNVAAGGDGQGYWVEPAGATPGIEAPVMTFDDNTAHSMGRSGFFLEQTRYVPVDEGRLPSEPARYQVENVIRNFRAYKNRRAGIWQRSYGRHSWRDARLADNQIGVIFSAEGYQADGMFSLHNGITATPFKQPPLDAPALSFFTLKDAVIIGDSANRAGELPRPGFPLMEQQGVALYDGLVLLDGCAFHGFVSTPLPAPLATAHVQGTHRVAAAITTYGDHPYDNTFGLALEPRATMQGCTFDNCPLPVLFPLPHPPRIVGNTNNEPDWHYANMPLSVAILDLDGSVPGVSPGTYLAGASPLITAPGAGQPQLHAYGTGMDYAEPQQVAGPGTAGDLCLGQFALHLPINGSAAADFIRIHSQPRGVTQDVYEIFGGIQRARFRFATNLLLSAPPAAAAPEEVYEIEYRDRDAAPGILPEEPMVQLTLRFGALGRSAAFRLPWGATPPGQVNGFHPLFPGQGQPLTPAPDRASFDAGYSNAPGGVPTPMWWHDPQGFLYVRLVLPDGVTLDPELGPAGSGNLPVVTGREMTVDIR